MDPLAIAAGMSAVGSVANSIFGSGSDDAAKAQKKAIKYMAQQAARARQDIAPYQNLGTQSLGPLLDALGLGDSGAAMSRFQDSPLYQLLYGNALEEGRQDVLGSASSRGMLNSGATLKALQDRRMGEANKFFGQYTAGLGDLATRGQNAATTSANVGVGAGSTIAGLQSGLGDIALAKSLGMTNTLGNAAGAFANMYGQKQGQSLYG